MTPVRICIIHKIGLVAGLALATSGVTASPGFASYERAKQACMGDAMRLCMSELPSIARITACMRRNKAQVSAGCRAVMDEMEGTAAAAAKPRPAQPAASAAPRPPATSRIEQTVATRLPVQQGAPVARKPAVAPPIAVAPAVQATTADAKPVQAAPAEQKPVVATPLESLAWSGTRSAEPRSVEAGPTVAAIAQAPPAEAGRLSGQTSATAGHLDPMAWSDVHRIQPASSEGGPAVAPPVVATAEMQPEQKDVSAPSLESLAWFEKKAKQMAEAAPPPAPVEVAAVQPSRPEPVVATAVEQPSAVATRSPQTASAVPTPVIASPLSSVALSAATRVEPVQAASAPSLVAPVNAHPVTARAAPAVRPVRVAQRKAKHRHVRMAGSDYSGGGDVDRAMAIALPILASVMASW